MPKLKKTYTKKDEIPAEVVGLYQENNGTFALPADFEVEGFVPSSTLDEFRTNNIALGKQLKNFEGIDPEKARQLLVKEQEILDAETKGAEKIKERVDERTKEVVESKNREVQKLQQERDTLRTQLQKAVIDSKALELATPFGLLKDAARNLVLLVNEQWTLDESGQPISLEPGTNQARLDGNGKPMRGTDGLQRFIEKLAKEDAKFLFAPNQGGGAGNEDRGSFRNGDEGEVNPFDPKTYNRTKQGELVNADFPKAKRMAAKFGIDLKPSAIRSAAGAAR